MPRTCRNYLHKTWKFPATGNTYDYSKVVYTSTHDKVEIECSIHGSFYQTPNNHTSKAQGCPRCVSFRSSKISLQWIEHLRTNTGLYIQAADCDEGEYKIPGTQWLADGFCSVTNTIYEFHGDYWHGNPLVYNASDMHPVVHITYGELYLRTQSREQSIRDLGFNVVSIWESEWNLVNK